MKVPSFPRLNPLTLTALLSGIAFICGLIVGLPILGWWLWPVQWTNIPQTPLATHTPFPTYTPFPTITSTPLPPSPTPGPDAIVVAPIDIVEGPDVEFSVIGQVSQSEEVRVVGQHANCAWLKITTGSALTGWVIGDGSVISLQKGCETFPDGTFRPLTGILKAPAIVGEGELSIENGSQLDSVVALVDSANQKDALAAAYIRSGESFRIGGIPDGAYIVLFATGSDWNGNRQRFVKILQVKRFEGTVDFTTTAPKYTTWSMTLQAVVGGAGRTEVVPPEEFPTINPSP